MKDSARIARELTDERHIPGDLSPEDRERIYQTALVQLRRDREAADA